MKTKRKKENFNDRSLKVRHILSHFYCSNKKDKHDIMNAVY